MKETREHKLTTLAQSFISQLLRFECYMEFDPYWRFFCQVSAYKWIDIQVSKYQNVFYNHKPISSLSLEIEPAKKRVEKAKNGLNSFDTYTDINQWIPILEGAIQFLKKVEKNWIGT